MGMNFDGFTVHDRLQKAYATIESKYSGSKGNYAKDGVFFRTFGPDFSTEAYQEIVNKHEYWKLSLQTQRAQSYFANRPKLNFSKPSAPKDETAATTNTDEAATF